MIEPVLKGKHFAWCNVDSSVVSIKDATGLPAHYLNGSFSLFEIDLEK